MLDAQTRDRPADDQLLDLRGALEDVEGAPIASGVSRWVRDQRLGPEENVRDRRRSRLTRRRTI
jgi:hypothetical protein